MYNLLTKQNKTKKSLQKKKKEKAFNLSRFLKVRFIHKQKYPT